MIEYLYSGVQPVRKEIEHGKKNVQAQKHGNTNN